MTPRIQKAIDIFLDAINNGTLAKGTCTACAVGNLAAHYTEGKIFKTNHIHFECSTNNTDWRFLFVTMGGIQHRRTNKYINKVESIKNVPFTIEELAQIEFAFETNTKIHFSDYSLYSSKKIREDQIKGLAAVVKVMLSFDNQEDSVEEVFTSKAELIPIS